MCGQDAAHPPRLRGDASGLCPSETLRALEASLRGCEGLAMRRPDPGARGAAAGSAAPAPAALWGGAAAGWTIVAAGAGVSDAAAVASLTAAVRLRWGSDTRGARSESSLDGSASGSAVLPAWLEPCAEDEAAEAAAPGVTVDGAHGAAEAAGAGVEVAASVLPGVLVLVLGEGGWGAGRRADAHRCCGVTVGVRASLEAVRGGGAGSGLEVTAELRSSVPRGLRARAARGRALVRGVGAAAVAELRAAASDAAAFRVAADG